MPSRSRTSIHSGSTDSSSGPAPSTCLRNHGCHPIQPGMGSSASSSIEMCRAEDSRMNRCSTRPRKGHGCVSGAVRSRWSPAGAPATSHATSVRVPWMACGGMVIGRWCVRPRNRRSPWRMRPAYGTIGNAPHPYGPSDEVTSNSCPSTAREARRPPSPGAMEATTLPTRSSSRAGRSSGPPAPCGTTGHLRSCYPLTDPPTMPRTKYRCSAKNTASGSAMERNAAAARYHHPLPKLPTRFATAIVSGAFCVFENPM